MLLLGMAFVKWEILYLVLSSACPPATYSIIILNAYPAINPPKSTLQSEVRCWLSAARKTGVYILHAVTSVYTPTIPPKKSSKNSAIFDPFGHKKMDGSPWRIQGRVTNSSCWTCRPMLPGGSQHGGPCWWSDDLNTRPMDTGEQRWKTMEND